MKKCGVCGNKSQWTLKWKGEKDRHYCGLQHLAEDVRTALSTSYSSPDNNTNAKFWRQ